MQSENIQIKLELPRKIPLADLFALADRNGCHLRKTQDGGYIMRPNDEKQNSAH